MKGGGGQRPQCNATIRARQLCLAPGLALAYIPLVHACPRNRKLRTQMENVILIVHLILALSLIGAVLLQRSEGGGLGLGGGGGGGGLVSSRSAATALGKVTWALAIAFIITSITLTIIAAQKSASGSVLDRIGGTAGSSAELPEVPTGESLLPPTSSDGGGGLTLPRADE